MNEIFEWMLLTSRPATAEEAQYTFGCETYDDCPCCTCGDDIAIVETYVRPRYSKSRKRIVEERDNILVCSAHAQ